VVDELWCDPVPDGAVAFDAGEDTTTAVEIDRRDRVGTSSAIASLIARCARTNE
jgi:hypothetical protein